MRYRTEASLSVVSSAVAEGWARAQACPRSVQPLAVFVRCAEAWPPQSARVLLLVGQRLQDETTMFASPRECKLGMATLFL
jgi:hypothetical protein